MYLKVRVTDVKDGVERIVYPEVFGAESTLTVHVTTVRRWLILVGYRYSRIKKGVRGMSYPHFSFLIVHTSSLCSHIGA